MYPFIDAGLSLGVQVQGFWGLGFRGWNLEFRPYWVLEPLGIVYRLEVSGPHSNVWKTFCGSGFRFRVEVHKLRVFGSVEKVQKVLTMGPPKWGLLVSWVLTTFTWACTVVQDMPQIYKDPNIKGPY